MCCVVYGTLADLELFDWLVVLDKAALMRQARGNDTERCCSKGLSVCWEAALGLKRQDITESILS